MCVFHETRCDLINAGKHFRFKENISKKKTVMIVKVSKKKWEFYRNIKI